ncbi:Uncharacterised protein [Sphingobacterium daejeonense]|nr:Uncharacterised protein [Sphingobacterium daejeonense]
MAASASKLNTIPTARINLNFPSVRLDPGDVFESEVRYKFTINK